MNKENPKINKRIFIDMETTQAEYVYISSGVDSFAIVTKTKEEAERCFIKEYNKRKGVNISI